MAAERLRVAPGDVDLITPGRRDYWVGLEHDTEWAEWLIPLTVLVGLEARAGEGLVAFGSTHGNEYEGPVAIKHLLRELEIEQVRGRIVLVPVLNPAAFRAGTLDGRGINLNRSFVEGAGVAPSLASITHRIVRLVRDLIWPHVSVVLDLHAGAEIRFALCSSLHRTPDEQQLARTIETARGFGAPFVLIYQNESPGLLTSEAETLGKIAVGSELGWGAAVDEAGVAYGRRGVLAAAVQHGFLEHRLEPLADRYAVGQRLVDISHPESAVSAPWRGWYEPVLPCGAAVSVGDTVGYVHDFDRIDEEPWPARAGLDGYVLSQAWTARIHAGQHIVMVGQELPWPD
jgi:N-alpha-acetyl-L-2,4-diaminobutyrate deacetylase